MFDGLTTWLHQHSGFIVILGAVAFVVLLTTLLATPWILARLPSDYFSHTPSISPRSLSNTIISIIRTVAGTLLIFLGLAVILTPVPGIVLMVLGLALCDFPGKHKLLVRLVRLPSVLSFLNWIREKSNKPPFVVPPIG